MTDDLKITLKIDFPDVQDEYVFTVTNVYKVAIRSHANPPKVAGAMAAGLSRIFGRKVKISKPIVSRPPLPREPAQDAPKKKRGRPKKVVEKTETPAEGNPIATSETVFKE